jgi:serine/threonine-protein kinase
MDREPAASHWPILLLMPGVMRDLGSLLAGGRRFEIDHAIYIIIRCCSALVHANLRPSMSPSRILISNSGEVTIGEYDIEHDNLGYGSPELIQAAFDSAARSVEARDPDGTLVELVEPSGFAIDTRRVIFALGSILWELLAGRRLFKGDTDYGTVLLVREANVPPLPGVPPELEAIVRKALAKDVDSRYQSVSQLGEALANYLVDHASN